MSLEDPGRLSDAEYAELNDRVDRFHAARRSDPAVPLTAFLPPAGSRMRPVVLAELIKTDMELRARANLPIRVESYLDRFRAEFPSGRVPVPLLAEEFRLRHRHADKPSLEEYLHRFPAQFDALVQSIDRDGGAPTRAGPPVGESGSGPPAVTVSFGTPGDRPPAEPDGFPPVGLGYRLIRLLGEGTFGKVYEAEAPGPVKVALKRLNRPIRDPAIEGELAALEAVKHLRHPYLLNPTTYWVFDDRLVIVMELADESLEDRLKACRKSGLDGVPAEELVPIFEQAAAALTYLHENDVTHRDIKPENILLLKGYAQVADFGLARTQEHTQTMIESPMGTLPYIAPEVFGNKIGPHSDQYSLAAAYVKARLGRYLFPGVTAQAMIACHLTTTPDLDQLPPAERKVLLTALAKEPGQRYPSCTAFARALHDAVFPPPPPPPAPPPPPRTTWITTAIIALLCGLIAGFVARNWPPPAPYPALWCPEGWSGVRDAGTATHGMKEYHKKLTRNVAGEDLVAILILPSRPSDPPPFYMTENKITNRVFQTEWDRAAGIPGNPVRDSHRAKPGLRAPYFPGEWRNGPENTEGKRLGIADRMDAPVVGVTVPEAILVANELGGQLPTRDQYLKAAGVLDGKRPGPAGAALDVPKGLGKKEEIEFWRAALQKRNLALGLTEGPRPVAERTTDVSFCEIHQLVSNGQEWTGENESGGRRLKVFEPPAADYHALLFGQGYEKTGILTVDVITDQRRAHSWTKWDEFAGFRLVIEVP